MTIWATLRLLVTNWTLTKWLDRSCYCLRTVCDHLVNLTKWATRRLFMTKWAVTKWPTHSLCRKRFVTSWPCWPNGRLSTLYTIDSQYFTLWPFGLTEWADHLGDSAKRLPQLDQLGSDQMVRASVLLCKEDLWPFGQCDHMGDSQTLCDQLGFDQMVRAYVLLCEEYLWPFGLRDHMGDSQTLFDQMGFD